MNFVKCLLIMQASLLLIAAQHAVLSGNPFMLVKNDFSEKSPLLNLGHLSDREFLSSDKLTQFFVEPLKCSSVIFYFDFKALTLTNIATKALPKTVHLLKEFSRKSALYLYGYVKMEAAVDEEEDDVRNFRGRFVDNLRDRCGSMIVDEVDSVAALKNVLGNVMLKKSGDKSSLKIIHIGPGLAAPYLEEADRSISEMVRIIYDFVQSHTSRTMFPSYMIFASSEPQFVLKDAAEDKWPDDPLGATDDDLTEDDTMYFFEKYSLINDGVLVFLLVFLIFSLFLFFALWMLFSIQVPVRLSKTE